MTKQPSFIICVELCWKVWTLIVIMATFLPPANEVGEGNVFTRVCLSTGGVDITGPMSLPGGGYPWSHIPSRGGYPWSQVPSWGEYP